MNNIFIERCKLENFINYFLESQQKSVERNVASPLLIFFKSTNERLYSTEQSSEFNEMSTKYTLSKEWLYFQLKFSV